MCGKIPSFRPALCAVGLFLAACTGCELPARPVDPVTTRAGLESLAVATAQGAAAGRLSRVNATPIAVDDEVPALRIDAFVPVAQAVAYRQFVPGQDNRVLVIPAQFSSVLAVRDVQGVLLRYEVMVHAPGGEGVSSDFYWTEVDATATRTQTTDTAACVRCHLEKTANRGLIVGVAADNRAP